MNKQIRRLGARPARLLHRALRDAQLDPGRSQADDYNNHPLNTAQVRQDFNRERGTIISADGAVLASLGRQPRHGVGAQARSAVSRGRSVRPGHRLLLVQLRRRPASSAVQRRAVRPDRRPAGEGLRRPFVDRENVGNVTLTVRKDLQQVAARRARRPQRARSWRSTAKTGELLVVLELSRRTTRTCSRRSTRRRVDRNWALLNLADGAPLRPHSTRSASSRARRSRSSPGRPACRPARSRPTNPSIPVERSYTPPDDQADQQLRRRGVRRRAVRDPARVVQLGVRADGRRDDRRRHE